MGKQKAGSTKLKMTRTATFYILIAFGLLDIVSFIRTYEIGLRIADSLNNSSAILILNLLVIFSLVISAVLWITHQRIGLIFYYFQFPFKLLAFVLTFGFVLKMFNVPVGSWQYIAIIILIFALEVLRLIFAIRTQKKYFRDIKPASP